MELVKKCASPSSIISSIKVLSILSVEIGNFFKYVNDEHPVPKSSKLI